MSKRFCKIPTHLFDCYETLEILKKKHGYKTMYRILNLIGIFTKEAKNFNSEFILITKTDLCSRLRIKPNNLQKFIDQASFIFVFNDINKDGSLINLGLIMRMADNGKTQEEVSRLQDLVYPSKGTLNTASYGTLTLPERSCKGTLNGRNSVAKVHCETKPNEIIKENSPLEENSRKELRGDNFNILEEKSSKPLPLKKIDFSETLELLKGTDSEWF